MKFALCFLALLGTALAEETSSLLQLKQSKFNLKASSAGQPILQKRMRAFSKEQTKEDKNKKWKSQFGVATKFIGTELTAAIRGEPFDASAIGTLIGGTVAALVNPVIGAIAMFFIQLFEALFGPKEGDKWEAFADRMKTIMDHKIMKAQLEDAREEVQGILDLQEMWQNILGEDPALIQTRKGGKGGRKGRRRKGGKVPSMDPQLREDRLDAAKTLVNQLTLRRRHVFKWCTYIEEQGKGSKDDEQMCEGWQKAGMVTFGVMYGQLHLAAFANYLTLMTSEDSKFEKTYNEMRKMSISYNATLWKAFDVFKTERIGKITPGRRNQLCDHYVNGQTIVHEGSVFYLPGQDNFGKIDPDKDGYYYIQEVMKDNTQFPVTPETLAKYPEFRKPPCTLFWQDSLKCRGVRTLCPGGTVLTPQLWGDAVKDAEYQYRSKVEADLKDLEDMVSDVKVVPTVEESRELWRRERCASESSKTLKKKKQWVCATFKKVEGVQSIDECIHHCCENTECVKFHYLEKEKKCHLKSGSVTCKRVTEKKLGAISGEKVE